MGKLGKSVGILIGGFLFILLGAIVYVTCSTGDIDAEELQRVASPDGEFEAVVLCRAGRGATVDARWWVYLVKSGERAKKGAKIILRAENVDGLELVPEAGALHVRKQRLPASVDRAFLASQDSPTRLSQIKFTEGETTIGGTRLVHCLAAV